MPPVAPMRAKLRSIWRPGSSASVVPGVLTTVGRSWAHSAGCEGSMPVASRASVSMWRWENGEVQGRFFFLQRNIVIPKKGEMGRVRA